MIIHFLSAGSATNRALHNISKFKVLSPSINYKIFHLYNRQILRIICTNSNLQSCNHALQLVKNQSISQANFLEENFNILNSPYLKLVVSPDKSYYLDDILLTNELKHILSRSAFSFDVNFQEKPAVSLFYPHAVPLEDKYYRELIAVENQLKDADRLDYCNKVYLENHKEKATEDGKPTEEQLLFIIDKLSNSLIHFFDKPQDYSIYHKNIVFQNNIKGVTTRGLNAYIQAMYLVKFYGYLHFAQVKVEILKVTHHIEDGTVRVRWRVNGLPRHKLMLMLFSYKTVNWKKLPEIETQWLDGFSVFSVDSDALIYKHICDKMIPDDDALLAKKVDLKSRLLGLLGLAPRGPAAGTINALLPCWKATTSVPNKKFT